MSEIRISTGQPKDLLPVIQLIKDVVTHMNILGIEQWTDDYPNEDIVLTDLKNGWAYLAWVGHELAGTVTLNEVQEPEYRNINWHTDQGKHLVVHRLAVNPSFLKNGIGRMLMLHAEALAKEAGYASIRLDTYSANPRSIAFYEKLGYQRTGQVHFHFKPLPYLCYDKALADHG